MIHRQSLGAHWHLNGSLKRPETWIFPLSLKYLSEGNGELTLVRRIDALSPHVRAAQTHQLVIPKLTVTTPSGLQVILHHVRVKKQSDTNELERITLTFQKIDISGKHGKGFVDDWSTGG